MLHKGPCGSTWGERGNEFPYPDGANSIASLAAPVILISLVLM